MIILALVVEIERFIYTNKNLFILHQNSSYLTSESFSLSLKLLGSFETIRK